MKKNDKKSIISDVTIYMTLALMCFFSIYFGLETENIKKIIYILLIPLIIYGIMYLDSAMDRNVNGKETTVILPDGIEIKYKKEKE